MTTKKRPDLGELRPGQQVIVRRSPNDQQGRKPSERFIPATVAKVGRVWVELKPDPPLCPWPTRWRMRLDTQNEATQHSGTNASFVTLEQHAWDETQTWARGVLEKHGLTVESRSPWVGREVELALLLLSKEV